MIVEMFTTRKPGSRLIKIICKSIIIIDSKKLLEKKCIMMLIFKILDCCRVEQFLFKHFLGFYLKVTSKNYLNKNFIFILREILCDK